MAFVALLILVLSCLIPPARTTVVAAALLPHGDIVLDASRDLSLNSTQRRQARELREAALQAGSFLQEATPELILLVTPHGIADLERHAFVLNPTAAGCLDPVEDAQLAAVASPAGSQAEAEMDLAQQQQQQQEKRKQQQHCVSIGVDAGTSVMLLKFLRDRTFHLTTGLSGFGPPGETAAPFPLGWGEVIPLSFLPDKLRASASFLLLSLPSRRYNESVQMAPELLDMGGALWDALEASPRRVAVLISGDLAHTHDPAGPYGFSKDAAPFDAAVGRWADSLRPEELLSEAARRQHGAKSCGFPGMVLLHGMLRRGREAAAAAGDSASSVVGRLLAALTKAPAGAGGQAAGGRMAEAGRAVQGAWHGRLLALHHPTYYGMAVAAFERRGQQAVALQ